MKFTLTTIFVYLLATISAVTLFWSSQSVQQGERKLRGMQAELEDLQDATRLLQAEWSYLTRPERLELLSARYLPLQAMQPEQLKAEFNMPMPVYHEVPTGPVLMPQDAAVKIPAKAQAAAVQPSPVQQVSAQTVAVSPTVPAAAVPSSPVATAATPPSEKPSTPPVSDFSALLTEITQPTNATR